MERETAGYILLGVESDNERRNVDDLLADSDVPLPDENTSVVNGLGETVKSQTPLQNSSIWSETYPSLNTWVCKRLSRKSSVLRAKT